jgi:hypothetical protein
MSYHDLSECTLTADERLAEAGRILRILGCDSQDNFARHERDFIERMNDAKFVSVKQLFWLRDLKDRVD